MMLGLNQILRCPYCNGQYADAGYQMVQNQRGYGVLKCYCGLVPVVEGIPILFKDKIGTNNVKVGYVIDLIKKKEFTKALLTLIVPPYPKHYSLHHRAIRYFPDIKGIRQLKKRFDVHDTTNWMKKIEPQILSTPENISAIELLDLYFRKSGLERYETYDYFAFRFGQPRNLVALGFASLIDDTSEPILELGCGFGHITHYLVKRTTQQPVVGIDREFFPLYVAKYWIAPGAQFVCADVNETLPFSDDVFSSVLCVDGIHYIRQKSSCIKEALRVTLGHGVIIFSSSRNALLTHPHAGIPLSPEGYHSLIKNLDHCLVADTSVLERYLGKLKPNLEQSTPIGAVESEALLSFVISKNKEFLTDYGEFSFWPHAVGALKINPLYKETSQLKKESKLFHRSFPSAFYEDENRDCKIYLPESFTISKSGLFDLSQNTLSKEIEELLEKVVIIGMPERY